MTYITLKNQSMLIDPMLAGVDQGWTITDGLARHQGCFAGIVVNRNVSVIPGKSYILKYEVEEYTSGIVRAIVGGVAGTNRNTVGEHEEEFAVPGNATDLTVKFYSDGTLGVRYMNIYPTVLVGEGSLTLGFNANENKFSSTYTFEPDMMAKFTNDLMAFKNGGLWKMNASETRNNFFGTQYSSKIRFICNIDYHGKKLWYNIRLDSIGKWSAPLISIPSDDQFPNGMLSSLLKNNFKSIDGKLWADLLRDINDPNFAHIEPPQERVLKSLFEGRILQGTYIIIELECKDTTEVKLASAEVYYTDVNRAL